MNNVTAAMMPPQSDLGATVSSVLVAARMRVWNPVTPDDGFAAVGSVDGIHIAKRKAGDYDDFSPINLADPRTISTSTTRTTGTTDPALLGSPPLWRIS